MLRKTKVTLRQSRWPLLLAILFCALIGLASTAQVLHAQHTTINASLFSSTEPPAITITSPVDGSTVYGGTITVVGSSINTTSVEVYINGVLVTTINTVSGSFSTVVTLAEGSNEVKLIGHSTYSGLSTEIIMTVIYRVEVPDGGGTSSGGGGTSTGGAAGSQGLDASDGGRITPQSPQTGLFGNLRRNLSFNFNASGDPDFVQPVRSWLFVFLSLGSLIIAAQPSLLTVYFGKKFGSKNRRHRHYLLRVIFSVLAALFIFMALL